jgi:hypothetical protein
LQATEPIKKGEFIMDYRGEVGELDSFSAALVQSRSTDGTMIMTDCIDPRTDHRHGVSFYRLRATSWHTSSTLYLQLTNNQHLSASPHSTFYNRIRTVYASCKDFYALSYTADEVIDAVSRTYQSRDRTKRKPLTMKTWAS